MSEPMTQLANGSMPHLRKSPTEDAPLFGSSNPRRDTTPVNRPANGIDMSAYGVRNAPAGTDSTRETAVEFVIDAVESTGAATRDDFDIDQIVTTVHALADDWDFRALQPDTFWRVASTFMKA